MGENEKDETGALQLFKQASLLHESGDFHSAESIYSRFLALYPENIEGLSGLCRLKLQVRQLDEALDLAGRILLLNKNAGIGYRLIGEIQMASGYQLDALESFDKALSITQDDAELFFLRGTILRILMRNEEALQAYGRALQLVPEKAEVLCNYGNVLHDLGQYDEAVNCFERALQSAPLVSLLHYNRGNSLLSLGRYSEALESFDEAVRIEPGNAGAWSNRSNALRMIGNAEESLASADRALALTPNTNEALVSRGNALLDLNKPQEAKIAFQLAVNSAPQSGVAYNGLGRAMQRLGMIEEAAQQFSRAMALEPTFEGANYNLSLIKLHQGVFAEAWQRYESRLRDREGLQAFRKSIKSIEQFDRIPRWKGPHEVISGPVSIWAEQGLGDQILFSSLLQDLIPTGQPFIYEVDARLKPAYQRSFPNVKFVAMLDPPSEELAATQRALFAGSLPGFYRNTVGSFVSQPCGFLQAASHRVAYYQELLGLKFKVAISWRSTRVSRTGQDKSAKLHDLIPLLEVSGVRFIDVQYGDTTAERENLQKTHGLKIEHVGGVDFYNDLDEVLAILEACDLLITTSNANAHLAAALGKPVWLLYPSERAPFHYWAHAGDHRCLWYPSVEIISGPELEDWSRLFTVASERLRRLVLGKAV